MTARPNVIDFFCRGVWRRRKKKSEGTGKGFFFNLFSLLALTPQLLTSSSRQHTPALDVCLFLWPPERARHTARKRGERVPTRYRAAEVGLSLLRLHDTKRLPFLFQEEHLFFASAIKNEGMRAPIFFSFCRREWGREGGRREARESTLTPPLSSSSRRHPSCLRVLCVCRTKDTPPLFAWWSLVKG